MPGPNCQAPATKAEVAELDGDDLDVDALADDGTEEVSVIDGMPEVIDDSYQED